VALYPELFERLKIPYIGGSGLLVTIGFNKYLSKLLVANMGMKVPKSNLYFLDSETKKRLRIGNWATTFPAIVKPNTRNCSAGITKESVVHNKSKLEKVLEKRLKQFPEGVLVEEFIKGKEIGVCYLQGYGQENVLFPMELYTDKKLDNPYNIVDYAMKNYALKDTTIKHLSIRLVDDLSKRVIKNIQDSARKVFEVFQVKDFCRIDLRVTSSGKVYFLELNPDITMSNGTHMFFAANKLYSLSYGEVLDTIIRNAAKRWGLHYYKSDANFFSRIVYKCVGKYYFLRYGRLYYKEP
jgi:D-alanine-D-alanine ligase